MTLLKNSSVGSYNVSEFTRHFCCKKWSLGDKTNLPSLVLKARHLGGSAFLNFYRLKVSEQALGGIPPGFGRINLLNFHGDGSHIITYYTA